MYNFYDCQCWFPAPYPQDRIFASEKDETSGMRNESRIVRPRLYIERNMTLDNRGNCLFIRFFMQRVNQWVAVIWLCRLDCSTNQWDYLGMDRVWNCLDIRYRYLIFVIGRLPDIQLVSYWITIFLEIKNVEKKGKKCIWDFRLE